MRVVACGIATVDVLQVVDAVPAPNQKVTARSARVEAGGPALNAALTAAALGASVTLVTAVGTGLLADLVRRDCGLYGVDVLDCAPEGFTPPLSTVLLTGATGERAVVSLNSVGVTSYAVPSELEEVVAAADAVLVDGHHLPLGERVATAASSSGVLVLLDGGSWKDGLDRVLPHVDVAVVSADFVAPGDELGPVSFVARSDGEGPVHWRAADGSSGVVSVPEVDVVDTLGAGDVLHGAMLAELARHAMIDLPASLTRAVEVASRSVTAPGARGWLAAHQELPG